MQKNQSKQIMWFLISQCITLFGSQVVQMAVVWYVTLQTGSGAWVAVFSVCAYLPQFAVSFVGGAWADRYSKRKLIMIADALIMLVTLIMWLILPHAADDTLLPLLLIMSLLRAVGAGIQQPAVNSVIPQLAPAEQLMRYNGINATMQAAVQFAAPAAAGVVLSVASLRTTLLIDVATAMAGMGMLAALCLPQMKTIRKHESVADDVRYGLQYVHQSRKIRKVLMIYGAFVFLTVPAGYLAGLLVSRVYGESYAYLTAVELVGFGGMAVGGVIMSLWGGFHDRNRTLAAGLMLFGCMAVAMALSRVFPLFLVLMALYGVALTAVQTTITTVLQEETEPEVQGMIFGLQGALYAACYPAGMIVFGLMADIVPMALLMILSGIALVAMAGKIHFDIHQMNGK